MSEIQAKEEKSLVSAVMNETDLRSLVYVIRGQQVMLDSDLAAFVSGGNKSVQSGGKQKH